MLLVIEGDFDVFFFGIKPQCGDFFCNGFPIFTSICLTENVVLRDVDKPPFSIRFSCCMDGYWHYFYLYCAGVVTIVVIIPPLIPVEQCFLCYSAFPTQKCNGDYPGSYPYT